MHFNAQIKRIMLLSIYRIKYKENLYLHFKNQTKQISNFIK